MRVSGRLPAFILKFSGLRVPARVDPCPSILKFRYFLHFFIQNGFRGVKDFTSGCKGDSGGPLYCRTNPASPYKLFGVAGFAGVTCNCEYFLLFIFVTCIFYFQNCVGAKFLKHSWRTTLGLWKFQMIWTDRSHSCIPTVNQYFFSFLKISRRKSCKKALPRKNPK